MIQDNTQKLRNRFTKNQIPNATASHFVQSSFLKNQQQKNEDYKNRTQNSTYNSMMSKMRDRNNTANENQTFIDEAEIQSKASWKIGVMGSHYKSNVKDLNESYILNEFLGTRPTLPVCDNAMVSPRY